MFVENINTKPTVVKYHINTAEEKKKKGKFETNRKCMCKIPSQIATEKEIGKCETNHDLTGHRVRPRT